MELPDYSQYGFLIADDKSFIRQIVRSMLTKCRARRIIIAKSGIEAEAQLITHTDEIDCILVDWNMAPINGLELLQRLRSGQIHQVPRDLPVVMLTGHSERDVVECALKMDVNGFVVKPVSLETLKTAIDHALNDKKYLKGHDYYAGLDAMSVPDTLKDGEPRQSSWIVWSRRNGPAWRVDEAEKKVVSVSDQLVQKHDKSRRIEIINTKTIPLKDVREGHVSAKEIYNEEGRMLVAKGVPMTPPLLQRLTELAAQQGNEDPTISVGYLKPES